MRQIGIIRRLDVLNRIVIPKEYCKKIGLTSGSPMDITLNDNNEVTLKKCSWDISMESIEEILNVFAFCTDQIAVFVKDNQVIYISKNYGGNDLSKKASLEILDNNIKSSTCNIPFTHYYLESVMDSFNFTYGHIIIFSNHKIENIEKIKYLTALISNKIRV